MTSPSLADPGPEVMREGWKEVALIMGCCVRTAMRKRKKLQKAGVIIPRVVKGRDGRRRRVVKFFESSLRTWIALDAVRQNEAWEERAAKRRSAATPIEKQS